jgi:hypothetical protein
VIAALRRLRMPGAEIAAMLRPRTGRNRPIVAWLRVVAIHGAYQLSCSGRGACVRCAAG